MRLYQRKQYQDLFIINHNGSIRTNRPFYKQRIVPTIGWAAQRESIRQTMRLVDPLFFAFVINNQR